MMNKVVILFIISVIIFFGCSISNDSKERCSEPEVETFEKQEYTKEQLEIIKECLGIPKDMEVSFEIGTPFYYDGADCMLTYVTVYTSEGYACGSFDEELELYSTYMYTDQH